MPAEERLETVAVVRILRLHWGGYMAAKEPYEGLVEHVTGEGGTPCMSPA
jgi:hypothetical protein